MVLEFIKLDFSGPKVNLISKRPIFEAEELKLAIIGLFWLLELTYDPFSWILRILP